MRLLLCAVDGRHFWLHRRSLAAAAREHGWEVHLATAEDDYAPRIRASGLPLRGLHLRKNLNPLQARLALLDLRRAIRELRPDLVHLVSVRSVVLGLAALPRGRGAAPPVLCHFTGLGHVFRGAGRPLRWAVERCLRRGLARPRAWSLFQNRADQETLARRGVVVAERSAVIAGSGVDLQLYAPRPEPDGVPVILYAGRMLRSKGVPELIEACAALRRRGRACRLVLAGAPDPGNPATLTLRELEAGQGRGLYQYLGFQEDVAGLLAAAHVACLPSDYGEGVPRFLLEAAAAGRPVVASDLPGCRAAILHERTGILVPPRSISALAAALERLLQDAELRRGMGARGREWVGQEFSQERVNAQTLALYRRICSAAPPD